ncbi:porin [Alcanivorax jadensis]|uniref:porin n=1 Tax=Alcanivorax jadensis TaxID=64988 RepID=UPI0035655E23
MFKRTVIAAAIAASPFAAHAAQSVEDLQKQIDILAQEVETLKKDQGAASNPFGKVSLGGYGEIHYNHYNRDPEFGGKQENDQIDAHRFVLFVGYDFTDKVRFFSEVELEHSLSGDGKPGEVELEQAYIEVDTTANTKLKMGQFLVPVGIINETHEPDTFYGVERNTLEKEVIPATWWEAGAMFSQDLGAGLTYDVALHSGLNFDGGTRIRSGRQKVAEADANKGAATGRIRYVGIPGLDLASSIQYQQDVNQDIIGTDDVSGRLVEAHARYSIAGVTATVQKARWDFNGFEGTNKDRQEAELYELSYRFNDNVGVFSRYENINLAAEGGNESSEQMITTFGVNYWIVPQVVVKADVQNVNYKDSGEDDKADDSINLGIGWSF